MPRKTKKAKKKARRRRAAQITFQVQKAGPVKGEFKFEPEKFSRIKRDSKSVKKADNSLFLYDPRLVLRDVSKTLLIALGVFSLEIVIYLAWFK